MLRKFMILAALGAALLLPADSLARGGRGGGGFHGGFGHGFGHGFGFGRGGYWGGGYWGGDYWPWYDYDYYPYYDYSYYYPQYYGQGVYYAPRGRHWSRCHNVTRSIIHHHQRYWRTVRVCRG